MTAEPRATTSAPQQARRPNVILLMTDQHRADALGCMGNPIIKTPHIDRLAAAGLVFENMFVQTPVCMASRASIFTGRYPRAMRVPSMGLVPPTEVTLAESLKRAGYVTGLFGKLHFTPMGYTLRALQTDHEVDDAGPFLAPAGIPRAGRHPLGCHKGSGRGPVQAALRV